MLENINIKLINFIGSIVAYFVLTSIYSTLPSAGCFLWCDEQLLMGTLLIIIAFVIAYNLIQLVENKIESKIVRAFIAVFTLIFLLFASDINGWFYFIKHLYN